MDHEHTAHRDHEQDTQEPTGKGNEGSQQQVKVLPGADQEQGRHGENDSSS